jgi:lipid-binding SYLF domain-containing protein
MKNRVRQVVWLICAAVLCASMAQAQELRTESDHTVAAFKKADSTLAHFFSDSAGYAVFPNVAKGGLVVGGARGRGLVYQKNEILGVATMTQASVGAQAGGQTFAEVIFFESPAALNDFKAGRFALSAEVSAVAAAEGASKTANYKNGVAVFTLPKKGLMVQASVGGQKFKFESLEPTGRTSPKSNE